MWQYVEKLSLCLAKYYTMRIYRGVDVWIHVYLSALAGCESSASRSIRLIPGRKASCAHWIGGWVGPKTGFAERGKIWGSNSNASGVQTVASCYTDCATDFITSDKAQLRASSKLYLKKPECTGTTIRRCIRKCRIVKSGRTAKRLTESSCGGAETN
jgi:hypothetical protein